MKTRKVPMRTCVVTHEKFEKKDLLRIVKNKEGEVFLDVSGKANGRGCYLKKDALVINKAKDNKILERVLETSIPQSVYDDALKIV